MLFWTFVQFQIFYACVRNEVKFSYSPACLILLYFADDCLKLRFFSSNLWSLPLYDYKALDHLIVALYHCQPLLYWNSSKMLVQGFAHRFLHSFYTQDIAQGKVYLDSSYLVWYNEEVKNRNRTMLWNRPRYQQEREHNQNALSNSILLECINFSYENLPYTY